eukprot:gene7927-8123_t
MRSTLASEVHLLLCQLPKASLPTDLWDWYMVRADRSEASNLYMTYIKNYMTAFGPRLSFAQHAGQGLQVATLKRNIFCWVPDLANKAVLDSLDQIGAASLRKALELARLHTLNKATPEIWQFIIDTVQAQGSFKGMLQQLTVPLMLNGYKLPQVTRAGPDCQYQHMSAPEANDHFGQQVERVHASSAALYGLTPCPMHQHVLQSVVCLFTPDWDAIKGLARQSTATAGGDHHQRSLYRRYTVGQLMTQQGLLLQPGKQKRISVKLTSEFLQDPSALSGFGAASPTLWTCGRVETYQLYQLGGHAAPHQEQVEQHQLPSRGKQRAGDNVGEMLDKVDEAVFVQP